MSQQLEWLRQEQRRLLQVPVRLQRARDGLQAVLEGRPGPRMGERGYHMVRPAIRQGPRLPGAAGDVSRIGTGGLQRGVRELFCYPGRGASEGGERAPCAGAATRDKDKLIGSRRGERARCQRLQLRSGGRLLGRLPGLHPISRGQSELRRGQVLALHRLQRGTFAYTSRSVICLPLVGRLSRESHTTIYITITRTIGSARARHVSMQFTTSMIHDYSVFLYSSA